MKYISIRTNGGESTGKISFYCEALEVSRQAFYNYLSRKNKSWKYETLADEMIQIHKEDEGNSDYGRVRMYQALQFKKELGEIDIYIPSEGTVRSVMERIGLIHKPRSITIYGLEVFYELLD